MCAASDEPDAGGTWEENVRSLDGAWIIAEMTGTMPDGSSATNILALGYDPAKKRYVGPGSAPQCHTCGSTKARLIKPARC